MFNSRVSYSSPQDDVLTGRDGRETQSSLLRDKIPARLVLYFLSWSGFLVSFMMRNDMNFALVAMIANDNSTQNQSLIKSQQILGTGTDDQKTIVKSVVISSFYWCYVLSQVVGGVATELFGTKIPLINGEEYLKSPQLFQF
uniref:Major facilitator superfamily transporter 17, isoform I n=1 Tax=Drosophila melanogaster TaxID=7227 RepID=A0A0C4DHN3_DROME|nr:major facilitator superfamily transporter 17, isoform I [Drosophila melanogaster]EDP28122.2 major facilitator superfamily transporter 17, isoform I [Drosophila melanogaster]|eukprot:NP_001104364.2 major facilitator superfamily transporter 17, isoform I [Drosophila melanogaster]